MEQKWLIWAEQWGHGLENYKIRTRYGVIDKSYVEKIQWYAVNLIH